MADLVSALLPAGQLVSGPTNQGGITSEFDNWLIYLDGLAPLYPGNFGPIRQLMVDWMALERRGELGPHLKQFPALDLFESSLDAVLSAAVDTLKKHPTGINTLPMFVADVFSLYGLRLACAKQELGRFERGVSLLADLKRHMVSVNALAAFLGPRCRWPAYSTERARESIAGFVGAVISSIAYIRFCAKKKELWYELLPTPDSWGYLDIVYSVLERNDLPRIDAQVNFNAVLTVAEKLSGPLCFAEQQLCWVQRLKELGRVSRDDLHLTTRQLVALRAPAAMAVDMSVRCWRTGCAQEPSVDVKRCSRCKRVFYCSTECIRLDWPGKHKAVCGVLKKIQEALADDARQAEFAPWYRML